ncbi:hypothetical protein [Microvirga sp. M2]|uniref:hypothetical protein n=1 Tax=Microvirga sp. M2 TaxID=3073270 RepID=UPI0039C3DA85
MNRPASPSLLLLVAGFGIWSSAFASLYAANAIGCSFGWQNVDVGPISLNRLVLVLLWIGHLTASGLLLAGCLKTGLKARLKIRRTHADQGHPSRFLSASALGANGCALFATLWTGLPVVGASACL